MSIFTITLNSLSNKQLTSVSLGSFSRILSCFLFVCYFETLFSLFILSLFLCVLGRSAKFSALENMALFRMCPNGLSNGTPLDRCSLCDIVCRPVVVRP